MSDWRAAGSYLERVATRMRVGDGPLQWFVEGRCGFAAEFDDRGDRIP